MTPPEAPKALMIMVAGPYTSGTSDPQIWAQNLEAMNQVAAEVFARGHIPAIGVNLALPVIEAAGPEHFEAMMMPISLALAERCDAILRIGGPSRGADREVEVFRRKGLPVFSHLDDLPDAP